MACFAGKPIAALSTLALLGAFVAFVRADSVTLLDADAAALRARLELISGSKERIDVAYFSIGDDLSSRAFLASLAGASKRGLRVRLLVDSYRNGVSNGVAAALLNSGVKVREFHPVDLSHLDWLPYRLHDKLLVADRSALIIGGRNISDHYFGRSQEFNFHDRDLLLVGAAAHDAAGYFDKLWSSGDAVPFRPAVSARHLASYGRSRQQAARRSASSCPECQGRQHLQAAAIAFARKENPVRLASSQTAANNLNAREIVFLYSSRAVDGAHDISDDLLRLIGSARREILVETPYLVLTNRFLQAFQTALDRGVTVQMLTNSLATTNQVIAHAGYENQKSQLLRMGIDLWEYHGNGVLHGKSLVIDDIAVVGSYNLHPRSEYYDTEVAVAIADVDFAQRVRASIHHRLESASPVSTNSSPEITIPERRATGGRKAVFGLFRLAAPILKDHL